MSTRSWMNWVELALMTPLGVLVGCIPLVLISIALSLSSPVNRSLEGVLIFLIPCLVGGPAYIGLIMAVLMGVEWVRARPMLA